MRRVVRIISWWLFLLGSLLLLLNTISAQGISCSVSTSQNVNRRVGPGSSYSVVGVLAAGQSATVNSQLADADSRIWWHLTDGSWVLSEAVAETGQCSDLPRWPLQLQETPEPSPSVAPTLVVIPLPTEETTEVAVNASFAPGDEVTVFGINTYLLVYAEPTGEATVLEAAISGVPLVITGGPEVVGDIVWWEIQSPSQITGWVQGEIDGEATLVLFGLETIAAESEAPFAVGDEVVISGSQTVLIIFGEPDVEASPVEATIGGLNLTIIGGPRTVNGQIWWQVRSPSGAEGWVLHTVEGARTILSMDEMALAAATATPAAAAVPVQAGGRQASVQVIGNDQLNVRSGPGIGHRILARLSNGAAVAVLDGPQSADGYTWWKILTASGIEGWAVDSADGVRTLMFSDGQTSSVACAGSPPPRLQVGQQARQILDQDPVRVQNAPGGGTTIFQLYPGDVVDVIGGPECHSIRGQMATWWLIRGARDWTGWIAEGVPGNYYFEPS